MGPAPYGPNRTPASKFRWFRLVLRRPEPMAQWLLCYSTVHDRTSRSAEVCVRPRIDRS
jgi:hypothetical protein